MQGLDKLRKVLIIIFTTLSIIALVFSLCKKVGLCASSSVSALPLPVGAGYGNNFSQSEIDSIVANIETAVVAKNDNDIPYCEVILYNGYYNGDYEFLGFSSTDISVTDASDLFTTGATFIFNNVTSYQGCFRVWLDPTTLAVTGDMWRSQKPAVSTGSWFDNGVLKSGNLDLYPLYISDDLTYNGVTYFSFHGEELDPEVAEILQNIVSGTSDFADQMQELTSELPSDSGSTSTGQWLSNIFSVVGGGFTGLFRSFYNFLKPIFDRILDFFQSIQDLIEDIQQNGLAVLFPSNFMHFFNQLYNLGYSNNEFAFSTFLHNLCFCSPQTIVSIWNNSQTGASINALKNCASNVISCYNASPAQHVYWTFDFSNTLLGNAGVITIDFDWYNNIRTQVITVFSVFFVLGFIFLWLRKLPGIISGASSNSDDK